MILVLSKPYVVVKSVLRFAEAHREGITLIETWGGGAKFPKRTLAHTNPKRQRGHAGVPRWRFGLVFPSSLALRVGVVTALPAA
jgi:hypothetical protein